MSERKFASTTIRDSEDKLGLTPEGVNQLLAENNTTVAKTKGFTQIGDQDFEDGLIFTSLMKLLDAGNDGEEMAGISGIAGDDKKDPAFWAGGSYDEAIGGTAKAIIKHDGSAKFTDAEITGVINALEGYIGGLSIEDGKLYVGSVGGNRIELDPYNRRIRLINNAGQLMGEIYFASGDPQGDIGATIEMNHFYQGFKTSSVRLGGVASDVTMRTYDTSGAITGVTNYRYDGIYRDGVKIL